MADENSQRNTNTTDVGSESSEVPLRPSQAGSKRWLWLILIVVLLLALVVGIWWWKSIKSENTKSKTSTTEEQKKPSSHEAGEEAEKTACAAGLTTYESTSLGFGFCYPTAWGTAAAHNAKFEAADTGSRWRIGFSAKEQVSLAAVSADWSTTVPRDGTCLDPGVQTLPPFSPFSTAWVTETFGGSEISSATRGIEVLASEYLIQERVDNLLTNGVCLEGYRIINGTYPHVAASYWGEFAGAITTPAQHMASPDALIPAADRSDFAAMVKSIYKL